MAEFIQIINKFLDDEESDFWVFYNWFQDFYFDDKNAESCKSLKPDEVALMREINDLLAYAGPNPTSEERGDGIMDEYQFKERLLALKKDNIQIWKRY